MMPIIPIKLHCKPSKGWKKFASQAFRQAITNMYGDSNTIPFKLHLQGYKKVEGDNRSKCYIGHGKTIQHLFKIYWEFIALCFSYNMYLITPPHLIRGHCSFIDTAKMSSCSLVLPVTPHVARLYRGERTV